MGLFGPSKSELADRIEELEATVEEQKQQMQDEILSLKERVDRKEDEARSQAENAAQIAHAVGRIHTNNFKEVQDKDGVVETLDEPRLAWKATNNNVVKLLIPEGARVVHPWKSDVSRGRKKRTDEAIPVAFYDVKKGGIIFSKKRDEQPNMMVSDRSKKDSMFEYNIGEKATPNKPLNTRLDKECTSGIHFFTTEEKAVKWC